MAISSLGKGIIVGFFQIPKIKHTFNLYTQNGEYTTCKQLGFVKASVHILEHYISKTKQRVDVFLQLISPVVPCRSGRHIFFRCNLPYFRQTGAVVVWCSYINASTVEIRPRTQSQAQVQTAQNKPLELYVIQDCYIMIVRILA